MVIEIIPFGTIENPVIYYLRDNLARIFNAELSLGQSRPVPQYAFNDRRAQYFSSQVLDNLSQNKKPGQRKILAVIDKDLYVPELNFVFGEADPSKGVCIISLTRLRQSYWNLPEDMSLFFERALKEAVHETGHLLNLYHCHDHKCVMHFSNSLRDTDIKGKHFCNKCKKTLSLKNVTE
jgi:archaemetzincin